MAAVTILLGGAGLTLFLLSMMWIRQVVRYRDKRLRPLALPLAILGMFFSGMAVHEVVSIAPGAPPEDTLAAGAGGLIMIAFAAFLHFRRGT